MTSTPESASFLTLPQENHSIGPSNSSAGRPCVGLHFPDVSFFHFREPDHRSLSERALLIHLLENQKHIMTDLTKLTQAVSDNTAATTAAVNALSAAPTDQAAVDAAAQQIAVNTASLNAAVNPPAQAV